MAVTPYVYNKAAQNFMQGEIDLEDDTIKVAIVESGYSPDIDTDEFWSTPEANEASADDYAAGGETLANVSITIDTANDEAEVDADNVTWSGPTYATGYYLVIYKDTGVAASSPLIMYLNLGANTTVEGITWAGEGFIKSAQNPA